MSGTQGEPPLARLTSYPSPLASHYLSPMSTLAPRADCAHLTRGPATPMPRLWVVLGLTGTFMVLEAIGGWLERFAGSPRRCGAHAHRRGGARPHPGHRLDRPAAGRRHQDLRLPSVGDPRRAGERRGALHDRRLGGDRGRAANPSPRAHPHRAVPGRGGRRPGREPREPPAAARVAGGQPQRARRLPPRLERRAGVGRRAGGGCDHLADRMDAGGSDRLDCSVGADPGRRLAAAAGEHGHPPGRRAPSRGAGGRAAPDPGGARASKRCTICTCGPW